MLKAKFIAGNGNFRGRKTTVEGEPWRHGEKTKPATDTVQTGTIKDILYYLYITFAKNSLLFLTCFHFFSNNISDLILNFYKAKFIVYSYDHYILLNMGMYYCGFHDAHRNMDLRQHVYSIDIGIQSLYYCVTSMASHIKSYSI